jgi:hypothetical protein
VLAIVVRLEESDAKVELKHDAADRPDIARLSPAKLQNDFGCAVVTRRDDGAVMLVVKCGTSKVNQANVGALDATDFAILESESRTGAVKLRNASPGVCLLTFLALNDVEKSESLNKMFSGFKSVCVSLFSCRNLTE